MRGAPRTKTATPRGEVILAAIRKLGITSIYAAAVKCGLHEATLRRWIYTRPKASAIDTLESIERGLEIEPGTLQRIRE